LFIFFKMIVDWKITNGGDSVFILEVLLRCKFGLSLEWMQVPNVGSGGFVQTTRKHESKTANRWADKPNDEWNTF